MSIYNSLDFSKTFNIKHREVSVRIESLKKTIIEGEIPFAENYTADTVSAEYRGNKFTTYNMSRGFFLLLCTRFKGRNILHTLTNTITGLIFLEEELSHKINEDEELITYKNLFHAMVALGDAVKKNEPELLFKKKVLSNFKEIFPNYTFIQCEYILPDGDRVDILARSNDLLPVDVIIELKPYNKSAHKQLRSYATNFANPILINLTPGEVKESLKVDGITYINFGETLIQSRDIELLK